MRLDKYKFASLIAMISNWGCVLSPIRIQDIDDAINIDTPDPVASYPDAHDINYLMALMADGTKKIEAIKLHRKLTGFGLKESKDMVEKYWPVQSYSPLKVDYLKRIADALGTEETGEALVEVARNAHRAELELASQHNEPTTLGDILRTATNNENY